MYSQAMQPKQVESMFDVLDAYGCERITLHRGDMIRDRSGHLVPEYIVTCQLDGADRQWRDRTLARVLARAATEITQGSGDAPIVTE
jgi:hypothetical protein